MNPLRPRSGGRNVGAARLESQNTSRKSWVSLTKSSTCATPFAGISSRISSRDMLPAPRPIHVFVAMSGSSSALYTSLRKREGIEFVATGHYARVVWTEGYRGLHRAADGRKDQSYFLYRMDPDWLSRTIFPVGAMQKSDVWKEAEGLGLPADELKESQEICFVSQGNYRTFIEQELPEAKTGGEFVDTTGRVLGKHDGIAFYTAGQRRGLGISGGSRLYVQKVIPETRTVVVCGEDGLMQSHCMVADLNLFDDRVAQWVTRRDGESAPCHSCCPGDHLSRWGRFDPHRVSPAATCAEPRSICRIL